MVNVLLNIFFTTCFTSLTPLSVSFNNISNIYLSIFPFKYIQYNEDILCKFDFTYFNIRTMSGSFNKGITEQTIFLICGCDGSFSSYTLHTSDNSEFFLSLIFVPMQIIGIFIFSSVFCFFVVFGRINFISFFINDLSSS